MSISGSIDAAFFDYPLYGEVLNANPKIIVYKKDATTGALIKYKELTATCEAEHFYGGLGITCKASDTSQDEYTADAFTIGRSPFTVDGVTSEVVMIYYTTTSKTRDQRLDVELKAKITEY